MIHRTDQNLRLDAIVFESRNASYGAFNIRNRYNDHLRNAMFIIFSFGISVLLIWNLQHKTTKPTFDPTIHTMEEPHEVLKVRVIELPAKMAVEPMPQVARNISPSLANPPIPTNIVPDNTPIPEPTEKPNNANPNEQTQGTSTTIADSAAIGTTHSGSTSGTQASTDLDPDSPHTIVDDFPEFPNGSEGLKKFIRETINVPPIESGTSGRVYVEFIIDRNGLVKNARIARGFERHCDEEALRVVLKMPKWKPAKVQGRSVAIKKILPIYFMAREDE